MFFFFFTFKFTETVAEPFSSTYQAAEAEKASVYGTAMIALLALSLTFLVLADLVSIGQSLSLLMYNINLRDTNPFLQNGGEHNVNKQDGRPAKYKAYYYRTSSTGRF